MESEKLRITTAFLIYPYWNVNAEDKTELDAP